MNCHLDVKCLDGNPKSVWCVRVDGAGDEGPSHKEVAFLWAEKHLKQNHKLTCVTTRYSGGSYLNEVELMNGCLAVAHSNLYIPSTLGGPVHTAKGIDEIQLKKNLDLAADVYISRVQGAPCGEAKVQLYKGADGPEAKKLLNRRQMLLKFLSGKSAEKESLKRNHPKMYNYFQQVWKVYLSHKLPNMCNKYFLVLSLCFQPGCPHSLCMAGNKEQSCWYEDGPPLTYFPLPVPDPAKPWGSDCSSCKGRCPGHYMKPQQAWLHLQEHGNKDVQSDPPSVILQDAFSETVKSGTDILDDKARIENLAKETHLTVDETVMWLNHLKGIRARRIKGAQKAAAKRAAKRGTS